MRLINFALLASITFFPCTIFAEGPSGNAVGAATATANSTITANVVSISDDKKSIEVKESNPPNDATLTLSKEAQDEISGMTLTQGDVISITVGQNNVVTSIKPSKRITVPVGARFGYLLGSAAGLLILSILALMLAGKKGLCNFRLLLIGEDNRYSNSKFQIAIWFFVLITTYLATVLLRWCHAGGDYLQVDIPQHLLLLSGLSALTFAGAKAITISKIDPKNTQAADNAAKNAAAASGAAGMAASEVAKTVAAGYVDPEKQQAAYVAAKKAKAATEDAKQKAITAKRNVDQPNFFRDLLQNDKGQVDFGDFQMLVVTLLAVGVYLLAAFQFLNHIDVLKVVTLPDVDTTILSAFGLGQGAYLTKKYAGDVGES